MCGIAGVRRYGPDPIPVEMLQHLLMLSERRGSHATGVAIQQEDGSIDLMKGRVPATTFVHKDSVQEFFEQNLKPESKCAILHTRWATCGTPKKNVNNHPLFAGKTAVVHNGVIDNHTSLFSSMGLPRTAETDSDILRGILDKYGITQQGIRKLNLVDGRVAMAAISTQYPGKLLLAKSGGPIQCAYTGNLFVFASEKEFLYNVLRPWHKKWGIDWRVTKTDAAFTTMPSDTAWILGEEGLEWHQVFRASSYNGSSPNYRDVYSRFFESQERFSRDGEDNDDVMRVEAPPQEPTQEQLLEEESTVAEEADEILMNCPNCKTQRSVPQGKDLALMYCGGCNHYLDGSGRIFQEEKKA